MLNRWRSVRVISARSLRKEVFSGILILVALSVLAGCGLPFGAAHSGPSADDILAHTQKIHIDDLTLTLMESGTYQGKHVMASGTVKFTQNPARYDAILISSAVASGSKFEEIGDITGRVLYVKLVSPPSDMSNKWVKVSFSGSSLNYAEMFAFDNLSNAQVIGKETLQGIPVWHLQGDIIGQRITFMCDVFVRQDTYSPVETLVGKSGDFQGKIVFVYTAFNTGVSIALPSSDQVQYG